MVSKVSEAQQTKRMPLNERHRNNEMVKIHDYFIWIVFKLMLCQINPFLIW